MSATPWAPLKFRPIGFGGAQTQRSLHFFAISIERMPQELLQALAMVKLASARVNLNLGLLEAGKALAIARAAEEVLSTKIGIRRLDEARFAGAQTPLPVSRQMKIEQRG